MSAEDGSEIFESRVGDVGGVVVVLGVFDAVSGAATDALDDDGEDAEH